MVKWCRCCEEQRGGAKHGWRSWEEERAASKRIHHETANHETARGAYDAYTVHKRATAGQIARHTVDAHCHSIWGFKVWSMRSVSAANPTWPARPNAVGTGTGARGARVSRSILHPGRQIYNRWDEAKPNVQEYLQRSRRSRTNH